MGARPRVTSALRGANGVPVGYSIVTRDLSEQRRQEEASREDAGSPTDYLTGVSTRRAFLEVAGSEVARACGLPRSAARDIAVQQVIAVLAGRRVIGQPTP